MKKMMNDENVELACESVARGDDSTCESVANGAVLMNESCASHDKGLNARHAVAFLGEAGVAHDNQLSLPPFSLRASPANTRSTISASLTKS